MYLPVNAVHQLYSFLSDSISSGTNISSDIGHPILASYCFVVPYYCTWSVISSIFTKIREFTEVREILSNLLDQ